MSYRINIKKVEKMLQKNRVLYTVDTFLYEGNYPVVTVNNRYKWLIISRRDMCKFKQIPSKFVGILAVAFFLEKPPNNQIHRIQTLLNINGKIVKGLFL